MTTVQCGRCAHFSFLSDPKIPMARHGFGQCASIIVLGRFVSSSFQRECRRFAAATDERVAANRAAMLAARAA